MKTLKKMSLLIIVLSFSLLLCAYKKPQNPVYDLTTIHDWLVADIWNDGFCDFSHYMYDGKDACGQSYDSAFALQKFKIKIMDIAQYDYYITSLPNDATYTTLKSDWELLKMEILRNYNIVAQYETLPIDGKGLDLGLYDQYDDAFADDLDALGY